jgi:dTDP-4-amino-4,6-dideoxygalactose transaminase
LDTSIIEEKITKKTRAILGVHLYGQPFDIDAVKAITDKYKIFLVEDAAQAHGALFKNKVVGCFGEMACYSFYPSKNLGTYGEGGCITTNDISYYYRLQSLRNYGSSTKYFHQEVGFNMRMGSIEAAIVDIKLKYLDGWNKRRIEIAQMYQRGITNKHIILQEQPAYAQSVYHLFVVTTKNREQLINYLQQHGIFPGLHYPVPCHLQQVYQDLGYKKGDLPNSEYLANHCLSLPMYAELTNLEVNRVIDVLNTYSCGKKY